MSNNVVDLLASCFNEDNELDPELLRHALYIDPDRLKESSSDFEPLIRVLLGEKDHWARGWGRKIPGTSAGASVHTKAFVEFVMEEVRREAEIP